MTVALVPVSFDIYPGQNRLKKQVEVNRQLYEEVTEENARS
jgi:hypothetical protein